MDDQPGLAAAFHRCAAWFGVALLLPACVMGEGTAPVPRESVTVQVKLEPGGSAVQEFHIEAETFESNESFRIWMSPTLASLQENDVRVEQTWTRGDQTEDGWPETIDIGPNELIEGVLTVNLSNRGDSATEFELRVELDGGGQVPEPTLENLRLEISAR